MIIVGTRSTLVKSEPVSEPCPNCKADNSLKMDIYSQYGTIFFIPTFPSRYKGELKCSNCGQVFQLYQMPMWARPRFESLKADLKRPLWHSTGLFLIALSAIALIIGLYYNNKKNAEFISNPKVNDVFEIKLNDTAYTLYKIKKIEGDTVYFSPNKFQTSQVEGLGDLAEKGYDTSKTYGISKAELLAMNKRGEIFEVDRK